MALTSGKRSPTQCDPTEAGPELAIIALSSIQMAWTGQIDGVHNEHFVTIIKFS